ISATGALQRIRAVDAFQSSAAGAPRRRFFYLGLYAYLGYLFAAGGLVFFFSFFFLLSPLKNWRFCSQPDHLISAMVFFRVLRGMARHAVACTGRRCRNFR